MFGIFEDDFPFSCLVGYVNFLEGTSFENGGEFVRIVMVVFVFFFKVKKMVRQFFQNGRTDAKDGSH